MIKVILVEPDKELSNYIQERLGEEGISVYSVNSEIKLIEEIEKNSPDLVLLEHELNQLDCHDLCKQITENYPDLPIIIIIDEADQDHLVRDFKLGIDDYVTKPLSIEDLLTRIRVRLTSEDNGEDIIKISNLEINLNKYEVSRNGQKIDLSPREFSLLKFLARNKGRVLSREVILNRVWSYPVDVQSRAVDVYIGYLRNKIDQGFEKKIIHTVRGFGYMLKD